MRRCHPLTPVLLLLWVDGPVSAGDLDFAFSGNQYTIVATGELWATANADAQSRFFQAVPGHLCTVGSQDENSAIFDAMIQAGVTTRALNGGNAVYGWLGGSDDPGSINGASEGEFFWVDGEQFWSGGQGGTAVGAAYVNFGLPIEPDDFGGGQDHLAMAMKSWPVGGPPFIGGPAEWNDVNSPQTNTELGYCIEFETAIFLDGFESGETSVWTHTAP